MVNDRRTFLANAAAAAIVAKISPLRSFGFTSDGPQTIHPTISDREKAGLRGPVKQYTEETIIPDVQGGPEVRFSQTTEYDPDRRILSTANISTDGSKGWVTTNTYDDNGRLTKTVLRLRPPSQAYVLLTRGTFGFPPLPASLLSGVPMTEERNHAILFSATIPAARKLAEIGDKPCPAREANR